MKNNTLKIAIELVQNGTSDKAIKKLLNIDDMLLQKAKSKAVQTDNYLNIEQFRQLCTKVKATYSFYPEYKFHVEIRVDSVFISSNTMEILDYFNRHSEGEMLENGYLLKLKQA